MNRSKTYLLVLALLEWFGLIAQLILILDSRAASPGELLMRYFTFFTITTNVLVGVWALALLIKPTHRFFSHPSTQTAIIMYISVVGLIYNLLLRNAWPSSGLQTVVHEILHSIIPPMVIIYWALWVDARSLKSKVIGRWLLYPALYTIIIFIRGAIADWYPYPFLDLRLLSTAIVIRNCLGILGVFLLFSVVYYYWGRKKSTPRTP